MGGWPLFVIPVYKIRMETYLLNNQDIPLIYKNKKKILSYFEFVFDPLLIRFDVFL